MSLGDFSSAGTRKLVQSDWKINGTQYRARRYNESYDAMIYIEEEIAFCLQPEPYSLHALS